MHERWVPRAGVLAAAVLVLGPLLGAAFAVPGLPAAAAADPAVVELEIESTISLTKMSGSPVVDGAASVHGRIRLEPGSTPGTWRGRGELASTTSSGLGGCGSTHVEGEGTYDWVVNEVVVSPGIDPERIVAHMDAGPAVEAPDVADLDACGSTIPGTLNTWENVFFFLHRADFKAQGFEVRGWQLQATGSTWEDGQLIASASWAASCGDSILYGCSEETVFRLYAAGAVSGPLASPSAAVGEPTPTPTLTAAPPGGGLAVRTVEVAGLTLTNGCLELWTDAGAGARGTLVAEGARCDAPLDPTGAVGPEDGWVDGSLGWSGLAPGRYVVVETRPPTDGRGRYETVADTSVEISAGAVSALTLTHRLTDALTIYKVDAAGAPVPGACFSLEGEAGLRTIPPRSFACDGPPPAGSGVPGDDLADGILVLPSNNLTGEPGTYSLVESRPPAGYAPIAVQTVELSPATPTVLTVTNTPGSGGAPAPTPAPSPTPAPISAPIAGLACDDLADCAAAYWPFVLGGIAAAGLAAVLGIQLVRRRSVSIEPIPPPTLNAAAAQEPALADISLTEQGLDLTPPTAPGEVPGTGLDYDKLDYDKLAFDKLEGVDLEASTTDFEKLPPDADAPGSQLDYDKLDYDKLDVDKLGLEPPDWK